MSDQSTFLDLTADIIAAFVSKNTVRTSELPDLIATVHASLSGLGAEKPAEEPAAELKPAVPIKKSVTDEYLICLDDGKRFKSLKRHLAQLGMTPDEYRSKWGLPRDYPMVAPGYAAKRSELAKASGLGNSRRTSIVTPMEQAAPMPVEEPQPEPQADSVAPEAAPAEQPVKRRGRPRKAA